MLWSALEVNFVVEMLLERGLLRGFDECLNPDCFAWSAALKQIRTMFSRSHKPQQFEPLVVR